MFVVVVVVALVLGPSQDYHHTFPQHSRIPHEVSKYFSPTCSTVCDKKLVFVNNC